MVQTRVTNEIRQPEPPPEASQLGFVVWLRHNLFSSPANSVITVVLGVVIVLVANGALNFLMAEDRLWEVIPPNSANYSINAYPRENLARIWTSVGVVAVIVGLAVAAWRPAGRIAPGSIANAVRSTGIGLVAIAVLAPSSYGLRLQTLLLGLVLAVAAQAAIMALGDRALDRSIPTTTLLLALIGLLLIVLWLLPIARTTQLPWTIIAVLGLAAYFIGRSIAPRGLAGLKAFIVPVALLSLPVIYLHVQRAPQVPGGTITDWLTWIGPIGIVGLVILPVIARAGREQAGIINAVLVIASIGIWFISTPMIARFMLLALTVIALATPTFGSGGNGRRVVLGAWIGTFILVVYLFAIGVATPGLDTRNDYFGGLNLTFMLAIAGLLLSFPIGILMALGRTSSMPVFRLMSTGYIELIRGVPLITVLFFFRFGILNFLPPGLEFEAVVLVLAGIALFSAAYLAENVRGGLQSIPNGQYEAAKAMGMTTAQMTMLITLPQALRAVIPAIVGQVITLFKDTSLVAIVGLADFFRVANNIVPGQPSSLGSKIENLVLAAVVYWIFTFTFSRASLRLERRLGVGTR